MLRRFDVKLHQSGTHFTSERPRIEFIAHSHSRRISEQQKQTFPAISFSACAPESKAKIHDKRASTFFCFFAFLFGAKQIHLRDFSCIHFAHRDPCDPLCVCYFSVPHISRIVLKPFSILMRSLNSS